MAGSKSKQKGSRWEREVADFLALTIPGVDRRVLHGNHDHGDIAGIAGWVIECKSEARLNLAGAVDEATVEAHNAKVPWFAAVTKRRGKGPAHAYATVPLFKLVELIALTQPETP
jgi:hypothetical protein